ncbi:MAG: hypothetical protein R3C61_28935 [Bacteroidia bacterium]
MSDTTAIPQLRPRQKNLASSRPETIALASPNVIDPGIWFVLQNRSDLTNQNMALKVKDDGTTEMEYS